MQKIKTKIEKWLNARKKLATIILFWGATIAIGVFWVGQTNYLEIQAQTVLAMELPRIEYKRAKIEDLSVLRGTPMEEAIPYIIEASEYYEVPVKYYLCVANAESSFKNFPQGTYNPFGIKPNNSLKGYQDWQHSINGFSQLIKYYYLNEGRLTAEQLMPKYVGYQSDAWVNNCNKFLK